MPPISTTPVKRGLEHLKGMRFAYRTKYNGMTFGTITDVGVTHTMAFDPETEDSISRVMAGKTGTGHKEASDCLAKLGRVRWSGTKIEPFIISETGIRYNLNEIYVINMYDDKQEQGD